ncbi:MAG: flagellar basal-body rod protein FlgF [Geminicoccaceae bacterium]
MDTTNYVTLSRQIGLQRQMTMIAGNIANAMTTGFQAERPRFEAYLEDAGTPGNVAFVQQGQPLRDLSPGEVTTTGNRLDVALAGEGYLAFAAPGGTRYGRAGHFEIDANGQLVGEHGYPVLDDGGSPIVLPLDDHEITIAEDGNIATRAGPVARLQIVTFPDQQQMQREGEGLLSTSQTPTPVTDARVVQGALEGSNVRPVVEITRMMEVVRAFEGAQRLLDTQHDLDRRAVDRMTAAA